MNVLLIPVESEPMVVDIEVTVKSLQDAVGGYFQPVGVGRADAVAYVNEEGLVHDLPFNPLASWLCSRALVGDVAVVGPVDRNGNDTPVPDEVVRLVMENDNLEAL